MAERFRLRQVFWLDMHKPEECVIAEDIAVLKEGRKFSYVARSGIRLMVDLLQGKIDVLCELFPNIEDTFYEKFSMQKDRGNTVLENRLERIETLLSSQPVTTEERPEPHLVTQEEVPVMVVTDTDTTQNFFDNLMDLG